MAEENEDSHSPQITLPSQTSQPLVLIDKDGWNLIVSGFIEFDMISDSTRSLGEMVGNSPVDPSTTAAGANGRTQFSVRNTRLAFLAQAPQWKSWKTQGYLETDFLGFDPSPPGATGISNTEAGLFNSPTLRIRHAYLQADADGFQLLAGQTWQLFGWQPYYFLSSVEISPVPAMLYGRTAQLRAMKTLILKDMATIQVAAVVARPPQRDAIYPDLQAGLRFAFNGRTSGFSGGSSGAIVTQPMSFAVSGLFREINFPSVGGGLGNTTDIPASAYALDFMFPVIPSPDGKSVGNTLSLLGEYSSGSGYGDQFVGWTGNMANPLNSSSIYPSKNVNLDAGIGDYNSSGSFSLVDLTTFNLQLQYHFPDTFRTFFDLGVGSLYSDNMSNLVPSSGLTSAGKIPYNRESVAFANIIHCFSDQIRVGFEYAHFETTYGDGSIGFDNRYQVTTLFIF